MFGKILHFVKYNNAFTIGLMALFLGAGMSFAASPALRDNIYASEKAVTSVNNHEIVSAVLDDFNFNLIINSVKEDNKNYYVAYSYQTLAISNSIWQKVSREKMLTVSKESLGDKDLGLYVAHELGDNIKYELSYLQDTQNLEKGKGVSDKVVTTKYAGLVGKLLDPKEEVITGYDPVIPEVAQVVTAVTEAPVAPDPSLFIENTPGYVKPPLNNPTTIQQVDEGAVRRIVEQMLLEQNAIPAPVNEPTPSTPNPIPESTPTPEPVPAPESSEPPELAATPPPEITPAPDVTSTPTPEPTPQQPPAEITEPTQ